MSLKPVQPTRDNAVVRARDRISPAIRSLEAARETRAGLTPLRTDYSDRRLGEVMSMLGMMTSADVDRALAYQRRRHRLFGDCCRRLRLVTARQLEQSLACQFGFAPVLQGENRYPKSMAIIHEPFGAYADAMRTVQGRLVTRVLESGQNVLAVTGAGTGIGRSHVAANLAAVFAQSGWRTLLVDADMRTPTQHLLFGVDQHPGLSRLLCGYAAEEVAHTLDMLWHLTLITAGPLPPNPCDLLARPELEALLHRGREVHDIVIVDTPCSIRYPDAEMIASAAGGALVVAAEHRSRVKQHGALLSLLERREVQVLGSIMNTR